MSQRVQKGNTVFRPIARPRPRVGGDSRQSSALPESSGTPVPSNVQDTSTPREPSAMPPPSTVPTRPSTEQSPSSQSPAPNTLQGAEVTLAPERPLLLSNTVDFAIAGVPQSSAQRITPTPSRLPPRIGSSQPPSIQPGVAIAMPSRTMVRAPPPPSSPPAPSSIMPIVPPSSTVHAPGPGYSLADFFASPGVGILENAPVPASFSIDMSQIDPQLIGSSGTAGAATIASQDADASRMSSEQGHRPAIALNDVPAVKAPRPRRTQRKKSGTGDELQAEDEANQDRTGLTDALKRRRTRRTSIQDQNASDSTGKKRKRSETAEPCRSRKRAPSPPPFDPNVDPGDDLDPTSVTMAALCDDTGHGRVSSKAAQIVSNHAAWRAANREKRARMKAAMEAKKYGRNIEEEENGTTHASNDNAALAPDVSGPASRAASVALDPNASTSVAEGVEESGKDPDGFDYSEDLAVSRFNVQVRIGANGETIVDEESLYVNRNEEHQTEEYTHVEESDFTKFVNSATYSKKLRGSRWSAEETELFYDALSQFGENYELISYVLPGRDRKACKNKFKAEDKKDPVRITYCLKNRRPYDIATLSRLTGKDFSGPTPEIRAPTPLRSTELQVNTEPPAPPSPRAGRKKSKTPNIPEAGVEIVGGIDEVEQDDVPETSAPA
ncbi:hypothetical protein BD413DRAFT_508443 [Trametes elegans]|nr:hypothetical protein BD413DRAFT_508443 [Trametes elegans]